MKNNTVTANNGVEVYTNNIFTYTDEYIDSLNKPEDIYKKQCFAGMIKYISNRIKSMIDIDVLYQGYAKKFYVN